MTKLRKIALVAKDMDLVKNQFYCLLGLSDAHVDHKIIQFGLQNIVMSLGDTFLELVTPVKENTSAERFLEKRGGDGGYMVIVDSLDLEKERKRLETSKMDIVWHENRGSWSDGLSCFTPK